MTIDESLDELRALSSEQTRKTYRRHGVGENLFGVSFANLGKLQKKIKVDHDLAQQLWVTGNHDARLLATMIADPQQADDRLLEAWAKDLDNYGIADAFAKFASATPLARRKMEQWTRAHEEWRGAAGWNLLAHLALKDGGVDDDYFEPYLSVIEREIHERQNRVRYSMNGALIAIGLRSPKLQARALAVAQKIGAVEVDHGATDCKTPDAATYIRKSAARGRKPMQVAPGTQKSRTKRN